MVYTENELKSYTSMLYIYKKIDIDKNGPYILSNS